MPRRDLLRAVFKGNKAVSDRQTGGNRGLGYPCFLFLENYLKVSLTLPHKFGRTLDIKRPGRFFRSVDPLVPATRVHANHSYMVQNGVRLESNQSITLKV